MLLSVVKSFQNSAQREHKERIYEQRKDLNKALSGLLSRLEDDVLNVLREIRRLAHDDNINDLEKVRKIRSVLIDGKESELTELKTGLENELKGENYYGALEARSLRLQNRVSPILKAMCFQSEPSTTELIKTIEHFKEKDGVITQIAPLDLLEAEELLAQKVRNLEYLFIRHFCSCMLLTL